MRAPDTGLSYLKALCTSAFLLVACNAADTRETTRIALALDGDTLLLDDQQRVRLIGIDAPELDEQAQTQAGRQAQRALQSMLGTAGTLRLVHDREQKDRYGRILAYVESENYGDIGEKLLREGVARFAVYPPNVARALRYGEAELDAIKHRRGRWSQDWRLLSTNRLPKVGKMPVAVVGVVTDYRQTDHNHWLTLDDQLTVKIEKHDAESYFDYAPTRLLNRTLLLRGRLYQHDGETRLRIVHPAQVSEWNQ